jgi:hypothetical protein
LVTSAKQQVAKAPADAKPHTKPEHVRHRDEG